MKKIFVLFAVATALLSFNSCKKSGDDSLSSTQGYFFENSFSYNVNTNPVIQIPVVRLGTSGDLSVNVTSSGPSLFSVPSSAVISNGNKVGYLEVSYSYAALQPNEEYKIELTIPEYSSLYGYGKAVVTIEKPLISEYYEYGEGKIVEGWWGEEEDKVLYVREYSENILQCYLPECWGHDSGAGYPVKDYVFYWNTATNMLYVPVQAMGCEDWCIADRGAIDCKFGGPGYGEGKPAWMEHIDAFYSAKGYKHPYYDPAKKAFYLSDSAAISPKTGAVVYGTAGEFDVFTLK